MKYIKRKGVYLIRNVQAILTDHWALSFLMENSLDLTRFNAHSNPMILGVSQFWIFASYSQDFGLNFLLHLLTGSV